jgi:phosphatidylserine decarboxylase
MSIILGVMASITVVFVWWRFYYFFRNPIRTPPQGEHLIVAPADGRIAYVKRVTRGEVPMAIKQRTTIALTEITAHTSLQEDGYLIGIFMGPFSVHRNRLPVAGQIVFREYRHAPTNSSMVRMLTNLFLHRAPLEQDCAYITRNERLTVGVKTRSGAVVTATQIADAWVNRIVVWISEGDSVWRGQQYGLIRLGSQVDTFIPASLVERITVHPGQRVRAGETVLAASPKPRCEKLRIRQATPDDGPALLTLMRQNPMVMDLIAFTDRSPDYFRLHRALAPSTAFLGENGGALPAAACSIFVVRGRLGERVVSLAYGTDLTRNADSRSFRALSAVISHAIAWSKEQGAELLFFTVNVANERMMGVAGKPWATRLASLQYVDIVPLQPAPVPKDMRIFSPSNDRELTAALDLINQHHGDDQLFDPWTCTSFRDHSEKMPNFGHDNVLCIERDGRLQAAAVWYDPSELSQVRLVAFDHKTALLAGAMRWLHTSTGLLFRPPAPGEAMPTIHLRRYAAEEGMEEHLLDAICNLSRQRGARNVCCVTDLRRPLRCRQRLTFRYELALFAATETLDRRQWDEEKPVFFDVTYS